MLKRIFDPCHFAKIAEIARNCPKLPETARNCMKLLKWQALKIAPNCVKLAQIAPNYPKLQKIASNCFELRHENLKKIEKLHASTQKIAEID